MCYLRTWGQLQANLVSCMRTQIFFCFQITVATRTSKAYEIEKGLGNTWGFSTKISSLYLREMGKWQSLSLTVALLFNKCMISGKLLCFSVPSMRLSPRCKAHVRSWKNSVEDSYKPKQFVFTMFLTSELLSLCRRDCSLASRLFFTVHPTNHPCRCTKSTEQK